MGTLFVISGPNKGELFPLATNHAVFGRDASCSCQLTDSQVSRQHFRITTDPASPVSAGPVLVDLGSVNGTVVNGTKITEPHPLREGDTIAVGNTSLRFTAKQPGSTPGFYSVQQIPATTENYKQTLPGPSAAPPS